MKKAGAYVMVQDPNEAELDVMPMEAISRVGVNFTSSVRNIADRINNLLN